MTSVTMNVTTKMMAIDSPLGPLHLVGTDDALMIVHLPGSDDAVPVVARGETRVLAAAAGQLREYFAGTRVEFDLPLAPAGTAFQQSVWRVLSTIPYGVTWSYGDVARAIGQPTASRAVGAANGRNPIAIIVPCHRVIGASGALTGYGGGMPAKQWLLGHEREHAPRAQSDRPRPQRKGPLAQTELPLGNGRAGC